MAINSLYPGYIRIFYNANGHPHRLVQPVIPVASGSTWKLTAKVTPANDWDPWTGWVTAFITAYKAFFPAATSFDAAELWTLPTPTGDPVFREIFSIGVVGTNATGSQANAQLVMTMRSFLGGLYRVFMMEGSVVVNTKILYPFPAGSYKTLSDLLIGSTSAVIARDGGTLVGATTAISKTNDVLRKKYFLGA